MKISRSGEYALRAMAFLAGSPEGEPVPRQIISAATGIPVHYVSKVLRRLVVAGLLRSQKGHGGGFSLALPPHTIRFLDILMATDNRPNAQRCAFGWKACNSEKPCPLHPAYSILNDQFLQWCANTTLASIEMPLNLVRGED
jgi:Rrf2 family protein